MRKRQQKIVEHVNRMGIASVSELAELFEVSPFTIRRDVEYLSQTRLVAKIKGGAQRIETPRQFNEAQLPSRLQINAAAKEKIAEKAVEFIQPGDTVFLDGSSTIACLARAMARSCRNVTVVTNSVLVSLELSGANEIHVIGLGGVFDRETFSYVGFDADAPAESFYVDKAFFSCSGFVPEEGTFEYAAFNRSTKRLIAQHAGKIFLLIDSTKFDKRAFTKVLESKQINTLITERVENGAIRQRVAETGITLVIAEAKEENKKQKEKTTN
jgi:DeoR/GlpR family transcriptional regulator of sugar metabolism